jgi:hypothetical protein
MGSCYRTSPERNALERLFDLKVGRGWQAVIEDQCELGMRLRNRAEQRDATRRETHDGKSGLFGRCRAC